jgi:hypothetical protein
MKEQSGSISQGKHRQLLRSMSILLPRLDRIGERSLCETLPWPGEIRDLEVRYYFFLKPEPELDDSDEVILLGQSEQPFASVQKLAQLTHLPWSIVYRRLT